MNVLSRSCLALLLPLALAAAGTARAQGSGATALPGEDAGVELFGEIVARARDAGFTGDIGILWRTGENAQRILVTGSSDRPGRWPWAEVTKQIVAIMVMQQVERGRILLDAPVIAYVTLPPERDTPPPTIRQLLQHRSGLRNPEGQGESDISFYTSQMTREERSHWCMENRAEPPAHGWSRNNCDYVVLGTVLETVTGQPFEELLADYISHPSGMEATELAGPEMSVTAAFPTWLAGYGTSGSIVGSAQDMLDLSRALLDGRLLGDRAKAEMWAGDPQLDQMALGQWSYDARVEGCPEPVRIVEVGGDLGGFEALHIILPDKERALVLLGPALDTDFGTIGSDNGLAFAMTSLLACEEFQ